MRIKAIDVVKDQRRHSIEILRAIYTGGGWKHDKGKRFVSRPVSRIKAIDADKNHQRHSIEILLAGYIGRDANTMYTTKVNG
jgi:hypothetical protein